MKEDEVIRPLLICCAISQGVRNIDTRVFKFIQKAVMEETQEIEKIMITLMFIHNEGGVNINEINKFKKEMGYSDDNVNDIIQYLLDNNLVYSDTLQLDANYDMHEDLDRTDKLVKEHLSKIDC